ncbi:Type 1 glutamine amidotransferase-like domain-containing protein [Actinoplanes sp. RD1]|uniref:Type 1 glutamine amidotransferase-like domain-containing protein n=1 Tax=Actinoplanes sp. RD1 TaxID=3064538 RepID=UPI002741CC07|nr:Type 1 glutamine amidotransferase-like domain-containing protein [Actinoplanes sp. RD1]
MKLLLTSSGVTNGSIRDALTGLLGKPIAESSALFVPTGIYPFPGGAGQAWQALSGEPAGRLAGLGWKSLGILELTALPHLDEEAWVPAVRAADALLVWGGDPVFLTTWLRRSGLAALLGDLRPEAVYVGVSAGAMAATSVFVETYGDADAPPAEEDVPPPERVVFPTPQGDIDRVLVTGRGAGLVDFAVIPHLGHPRHPEASPANAATWAARIPAPVYAIDDDTAVSVVDGVAEVVSEGRWQLFRP